MGAFDQESLCLSTLDQFSAADSEAYLKDFKKQEVIPTRCELFCFGDSACSDVFCQRLAVHSLLRVLGSQGKKSEMRPQATEDDILHLLNLPSFSDILSEEVRFHASLYYAETDTWCL